MDAALATYLPSLANGGAQVVLNQTVFDAPSGTLAPTRGPAAGGTTVTVTGANLASVDSVTFGSKKVTKVKSNYLGTQLTVQSPAGNGTVSVRVHNPGGTAVAGSFTYDPGGKMSQTAACATLPARLPVKGLKTVLPRKCVTNAGKILAVTAKGYQCRVRVRGDAAYVRVIKGPRGKRAVRT